MADRAPCWTLGPPLGPFVARLWVSESGGRTGGPPAIERTLPTGEMHVVFRIGGAPLRVIGAGEREPASLGRAVVGGARAAFYDRVAGGGGASVGLVLRAGAAESLLGAPADELAGVHTPLDALWGRDAELAEERLADATGDEARLRVLEDLLSARLAGAPRPAPELESARRLLAAGASVDAAARASGRSARRFLACFRRATGLGPKEYARVRRFQRALALRAARPGAPWTEVALAAGYSDHAHLARELRGFAGMTPGDYVRREKRHANHVVADGGRDASDSFKTARPGTGKLIA